MVYLFICFDFLTGFLFAFFNKKISSKKMREGLKNKMSLVIMLALCYALDRASIAYDIGFDFKLYTAISIYIIIMESISICENCVNNNESLKMFVEKIDLKGRIK